MLEAVRATSIQLDFSNSSFDLTCAQAVAKGHKKFKAIAVTRYEEREGPMRGDLSATVEILCEASFFQSFQASNPCFWCL